MTAELTEPAPDVSPPKVYDAFLSYTHRDRPIATGIQRGLHQIGRRLGALRALRVFRDDTNLEVSPDLWGRITEAMDRARYLVIVLSPNAAQSYWVNREVQYWLAHHAPDRLLLVLAGGRLNWDADSRRFDPAISDAALPVLTEPGALDVEPLTIDVADDAPWDVRSESLRDKITTLAAPIHGRTADDLAAVDRREQRRFRRLRTGAMIALSMLTITAVVLAGVAFAQDKRATAQRNRAIAGRLNAEAAAMLLKDEAGGDVRAFQELLAARHISPPDDNVLLDALAQRVTTAKIIGAGAPVWGIAVSPDGRVVASAERDHTVRVWDAVTGQPVGAPLRGHTEQVGAVAFSRDGRRLASVSDDQTVRLWDTTSWRQIGAPIKVGVAIGVEWSPDGIHIATPQVDGDVAIWDADSGAKTGTLHTAINGPVSLAYRPDGRRIAVAGTDDHTVHIWDMDAGNEIRTFPRLDFPINAVTYSPDGRHVVVASDTVKMWNADTGEPEQEFVGNTFANLGVTFSRDGQTLAAAATDGSINLWNVATGALLSTPLLGHTDAVRRVAFTPDDAKLVSGSMDGTVREWSLTRILHRNDRADDSVDFDPQSDLLAEGNGDGSIGIWDSRSGRLVRTLTGHHDSVLSVVFSPDGHRIASASADGDVRMWNADTGEPLLAPLTGHHGPVDIVTFSHDGKRLASGGSDGDVRLWNAETGKLIGQPLKGHDGDVFAVAFRNDDNTLWSGGTDNSLRIWNGRTGELQRGIKLDDPIGSIAFSPDGSRVAFTLGNTIAVANPDDLDATPNFLNGHSAPVNAVTFSPDGKRIASASKDKTVRLWDSKTGLPVGELFAGHAGDVYGVAFRSDGRRVASAGADGTVRLWDAAAEPELLCDKLTADISEDQWREWVGDEIPYQHVCPKLPPGGPPAPASEFATLPVADLEHPQALTVDRSGDLYVADTKHNRVLKVAARGGTTALPFGDIHEPSAIGVDDAGDVFVGGDGKVYKLAAGATKAVALPLPDLPHLGDIAVDGAGNLYVGNANTILRLAAGSNSTTEVSLAEDSRVGGLAVDGHGDIFATDYNNDQVLEFASGATQPAVMPFLYLSYPGGLTVDRSGNVFVADTDHNRVLELPAGWPSATELPFDGLKEPYAVAAAPDGQIYVSDAGNNRVLRLRPQ